MALALESDEKSTEHSKDHRHNDHNQTNPPSDQKHRVVHEHAHTGGGLIPAGIPGLGNLSLGHWSEAIESIEDKLLPVLCPLYLKYGGGCSWTHEWACPPALGTRGTAADVHTIGFLCCCKYDGRNGSLETNGAMQHDYRMPPATIPHHSAYSDAHGNRIGTPWPTLATFFITACSSVAVIIILIMLVTCGGGCPMCLDECPRWCKHLCRQCKKVFDRTHSPGNHVVVANPAHVYDTVNGCLAREDEAKRMRSRKADAGTCSNPADDLNERLLPPSPHYFDD